jgi:hypothetical protein
MFEFKKCSAFKNKKQKTRRKQKNEKTIKKPHEKEKKIQLPPR